MPLLTCVPVSGGGCAGVVFRCPDCVDAEPIVMKALEDTPNTILIFAPVLRSEYKGNPSYPYRKHAKVGLQAVPTLVRWGESEKVGELVEARCSNEDLVEALVEDED